MTLQKECQPSVYYYRAIAVEQSRYVCIGKSRRVTTTTTWYNAPKVCELLLISGPNTRRSSRDFLCCVKKAPCVALFTYVCMKILQAFDFCLFSYEFDFFLIFFWIFFFACCFLESFDFCYKITTWFKLIAFEFLLTAWIVW